MTMVDNLPGERPPRSEERVQVYLHAGQIFASSTPCEVSTVLGSCVAVLLVDPVNRFGGASHYLLPLEGRGQSATPRFGHAAISLLLGRMLQLGSRRHDLVAKVFGGASSLAAATPHGPTLGDRNVEVARRRLEMENIRVVAEDVGGFGGRKLVFLTDEGHVWVRKL
jgi:chemotaxis protein CheD